jgi:hybrid cluster-associated redox disulfide protein
MTNVRVTKDMLIADVIKECPEVLITLHKHGMHCIGCSVATWETLEQAAQTHNIDIDKLIEEINKKR